MFSVSDTRKLYFFCVVSGDTGIVVVSDLPRNNRSSSDSPIVYLRQGSASSIHCASTVEQAWVQIPDKSINIGGRKRILS